MYNAQRQKLIANVDSRPVAGRSVSRENSWSNEPSAMESSVSSDQHTISEVLSSEPEISSHDAKPQIHIDSVSPIAGIGLTECRSSDVSLNNACRSLSSNISLKLSELAEVIQQPVIVAQPTEIVASGTCTETAISEANEVVKQSFTSEICTDKAAADIVHVGDAQEKSDDTDATPINEPSIQNEDISAHLDETLSDNQTSSSTLASPSGVKLSLVGAECQPPETGTELHRNDISESVVQQTASVAGDARKSPEENLIQSVGSSGQDIAATLQSIESQHDVQSAGSVGNPPSLRSHSASVRHSASGASWAGSGSALVASVRSPSLSSRTASSIDRVSNDHSSIYSGDVDRSGDGKVSDKTKSTDSGSRVDSVGSGVSSKTFAIDSEGSGKVHSAHSVGRPLPHSVSVQHDADIALLAIQTGSEARCSEEAGVDTDDDVPDLEVDQSLHTKAEGKLHEDVDKIFAVPIITPSEVKENQELHPGEETVNLKDEVLPEDLDSDYDVDVGSVHSGIDAGSVPRHTSESLSDMSESKTGQKSEDLHRIIRKVAAAVESFAGEAKPPADIDVCKRDAEALSHDQCEKFAAGTTVNLLADAIDLMVAVRNHKIAATPTSTLPAVPLSPSALSDSAKSTASNSSDAQVRLV